MTPTNRCFVDVTSQSRVNRALDPCSLLHLRRRVREHQATRVAPAPDVVALLGGSDRSRDGIPARRPQFAGRCIALADQLSQFARGEASVAEAIRPAQRRKKDSLGQRCRTRRCASTAIAACETATQEVPCPKEMLMPLQPRTNPTRRQIATKHVRPAKPMVRKESDRDTRRALTAAERAHLMATADADHQAQHLDVADLLAYMAGTGVRISEALNQRWNDVNLAACAVHVRGTKTVTSERVLTPPTWLAERLAIRASGARRGWSSRLLAPTTGTRLGTCATFTADQPALRGCRYAVGHAAQPATHGREPDGCGWSVDR